MANASRWIGFFLPRRKAELKAKQSLKQEEKKEAPAKTLPSPQAEAQTVLIDSYSVLEPFVRIAVSLEPDGSRRYIVIEPQLNKSERKTLDQIKEILKAGLNIDASRLKPEEADKYLTRETLLTLKKFGFKIQKATYDKLFYYIRRDFLGYNKIDPLMRDPYIEDISCNGPRNPIFTFHRAHESIPTNVVFKDEEEIDKFIMRLAYMSGRHISVAEPVVDASLPDGSRIQMTFGSEVTKKGSTFTIRKFREDPYSIVDLIKFGTMNPDVAAALWFALENKGSVLMAGGTASGKSIPSYEKILIYEHRSSKLISIGQLYSTLAKSNPVKNEGEYDVVECPGIETPAFGRDLRVRLFRISRDVRHPAPDKLYRIRTRTGKQVTTTGDHSLFTTFNGEIVPYPARELSPGMFIAVPRILPESTPDIQAVELIELLESEDGGLYVHDVSGYARAAIGKIGKRRVAKILGLKHRSLNESLRKAPMAVRVSRFTKLALECKLEIDATKLRLRAKNKRRGSIPAVPVVSRPLMRLLGYWVAEGIYQRTGLSLFSLNEQIRDDIANIVQSLFNLQARPNQGDRTRLDINSKALSFVFRQVFRLPGGAANKKIPEIVFHQPNHLLAEFLKGYFSGDAWVRNYIEASTKSRELAHELLYALARFGIVAQTWEKVVRGRTYYRVLVYGQKNLQRFAENIGFTDRNSQTKIVEFAYREAKAHTNIDTIPGIAGLLKQCLEFQPSAERSHTWDNWHSYWSTSKRMGREVLLSFLQRTGAQGEVMEKLLNLAHSDLFWDEIESIEELQFEGKYVYDLEVPGAENFVGGNGGILLHNTTTINCLALFIRPEAKIVTIEDTPEINLAHINWIQSVSRPGMGGMGDVTLYDLLRAALRQRPDFIIVGEVRGEEASTMFQALSTGHAGLSSIHADSIPAVFHRLTNPPMSIPKTLIPAVHFVLLQSRLNIGGKPVRRVLSVTEVVGLDTRTDEIITNELFRYSPEEDTFVFSGRSYVVEKYAKLRGVSLDEARQEIATRKLVIQWMTERNLRRYRDVANVIQRYYTDKAGLLAQVGGIAA